jgi:hypothetical protein
VGQAFESALAEPIDAAAKTLVAHRREALEATQARFAGIARRAAHARYRAHKLAPLFARSQPSLRARGRPANPRARYDPEGQDFVGSVRGGVVDSRRLKLAG